MISLEEALSIHKEVVEATGGAHGLRDRGGLEAALARPYASFRGIDLYPDPITKAAALVESVVMNHPFVDGNKRTGYVLGRLELITHDTDLRATDEEEYEMVIQVATGQLEVEGIVAWMKGRVERIA